MFGFGRRKDEEVHRLQARGDDLSQQLEQVQTALHEANSRAEKAESQAAFLASQNRALAAKVHRLALQRMELQNNHDLVVRENKELQVTNLQLGGEVTAAKAAKADAWQVPNLQVALRQQAAQHENKMASLKRRTKALLTAMLPGGHSQAELGPLSQGEQSTPGSPGSDSNTADLWDTPLTPLAQVENNRPDVHTRVRQVIEYLYDDTLSEDQALEQMTAITRELLPPPAQADGLLSRGCSPFPVPKLEVAETVAPAEKVDAATDMLTSRARFVSDVATETPEEMSYVGTPRDVGATPSLAPGSPARLGAGVHGVPALDLAALVAQAMEDVPLSARSTASTSAGGSGDSFNAFSQFVLAQPEKLQRLIMRHAAATGGRVAASPYGTAAMPSAMAGTLDALRPSMALPSMDLHSLSGARPGFASRLLGLGGVMTHSSNNRAPSATAAPAAASSSACAVASGVLTPSSAGNTMSPPKQKKRAGMSGAPKLVTLDGPVPAPAGSRGADGPAISLFPGPKIITGLDRSGRAAGGSGIAGVSFDKPPKLDLLENDLQELSLGGSGALAAFRTRGAGR